MYCPLCAAEFAAGPSRCPSCGAPVSEQTSAGEPDPPDPGPPPGQPSGSGQPAQPIYSPGQPQPPPPHYQWQPHPSGPGGPGVRQFPLAMDLVGALRIVGIVVGATYAAALLVSVLFAAVTDDPSARVTLLTMPGSAVVMAFGVDLNVSVDAQNDDSTFSGSAEVAFGAIPLLLTALAFGLLIWLVRKWQRAGRGPTLGDRLAHAGLVSVILAAACLIVSTIARQEIEDGDGSGTTTTLVNVGHAAAFFLPLLLSALVCGVVAILHNPAQLPPGLVRFLQNAWFALREPLLTLRLVVPVLVVAGTVAGMIGLAFLGGSTTEDTLDVDLHRDEILFAGLPFAPNAAWQIYGVASFAPWDHPGENDVSDSSGYFSAVDATPWFLLGPPLIAVIMLAAGGMLAVRSPNAVTARRRAGLWSATFGVASAVLTLLARMSLEFEAVILGATSADVAFGNNFALMAVLSAAWAGLLGLVAVEIVLRLSPGSRTRWAQRARAPEQIVYLVGQPSYGPPTQFRRPPPPPLQPPAAPPVQGAPPPQGYHSGEGMFTPPAGPPEDQPRQGGLDSLFGPSGDDDEPTTRY